MKNNFPYYVKMGETALRYNPESGMYYRDAGVYWVTFKQEDNKLIAIAIVDDNLNVRNDAVNGMELIPITKEEWENDNRSFF